MKKITFHFIVLLMLIAGGANAQNMIAVQNNNTPSFYSSIDDAISQAINGDTLYLPGGSFNLTVSISKRLHFIGVGFHPDSTQATTFTYFTNTIYFVDGSDGSSIAGIYINGSIILGIDGTLTDVDNIKITRCNFQNLRGLILGCNFSNNLVDNFIVAENVVRGDILGFNGVLNVFSNNIIQGKIECIGQGNIYKNNIFLKQSSDLWGAPIAVNNGFIENNIFLTPYYTTGLLTECSAGWGLSNCTFRKNIFTGLLIYYGGCTNCLDFMNYEVDINSIFISLSSFLYNYTDNYHLQNPSIYFGTDGTQIGIYGGMFPWKDGSIPINPHYQSIIISPNTDTDGNLNINIKVSAQDR